MTNIKQVRHAAVRFRSAIEADERLPVPMAGFPAGACGPASELLGQYLLDCGLGTWSYIMGFRQADGWTHAWVESDGVIVDITADQFDDIADGVIVTPDREWHDREFPKASRPRPANRSFFFERHDEAQMNATYERLRAAADALA